jgi:hypothetical protein
MYLKQDRRAWTGLMTQDNDQWRAVVNMVINLRVS